ncbi:MAG: SDR family NAD(P)-dependent oxidoreductase [Novosphingobium sp.]
MSIADNIPNIINKKVSIIGVACRFPGGSDSPEAFFENMLKGVTCVGDVPDERWSTEKFFNESDVAGKAYVGRGHFLRDYDYKSFDADFFGLSPREVEFIDPQQRLLLELAWEAMDNAGLDVESLAGSSTGVFVGGFTVDHLLNQLGAGARETIGTHSAAGATLTMLSNRISYAFDFCGPSLSIDTACSSSLVAFSQAVTAIHTRQCDMALVGGANFILRPEYMVAMSKGRLLAKDGRSKSFDSRADGYGRGEGGGVVVLKAYDAALRDGDNILAVVDGAGVNQDGRTSGITVPNPEAQRALMVRVLKESGLDAADIDYIEAHGTGTPIGDPRETRAIADVYGQGDPCVIGSVKANIGHLEAAAGVASIIKTAMMLRYNQVPPIAGLEDVNENIPQEVILPRVPLPLNSKGSSGKVAVNSFGYGGTNAHVILSSPDVEPLPSEAATADASMLVLPLSARDPKALRARADQFVAMLEGTDEAALEDVLFTAGKRRTHMAHRVAVWGDDRDDIIAALRDFGTDAESFAGVEGSRAFNGDGRIAFVYTGMGPQWWGMGQDLLRENRIFRETLEEADAVFTRIAGFSILAEMSRDEPDSRIKRTEFAQPGNLMVQIGLTSALRAEGVVPDAVVGHSVGEVASAWASGMLTLEQALLVSRERSFAQAKTAGTGGMLALGLPEDDTLEIIRPFGDLVSIAAVNSPRSVTVAGDRQALETIRTEAEARKVFARALDVEVPYHSPLMEALKPELREKLASLHPQRPGIPLYSTVTGGLISDEAHARTYDAEYWCDNVRNPVYFADAIGAMLNDGYQLFVEVGPHPVLRRSLEEISSAHGKEVRLASTLRMNKPETQELRRSVCEIYANGGEIDWLARTPNGRLYALPSYPWQRQSLWREAPRQARDRLEVQSAPLVADDGGSDLNLRRLNYLSDHVVDGAAIMPAAGYLEALCEEGRRRWPDAKGLSLRDVTIERALVLDPERSLRLVMTFDPTGHRAQLHSRDDGGSDLPVLHASAFIYPDGGRPVPSRAPSLADTNEVETVDVAELYANLSGLALQYGPAFQPITGLRRDKARGIAEAELTRPECAGDATTAYVLHPALLDGCFQTALALVDASDGAYLPVSLRALEVYAALPESILCYTRIVERNASEIVCDFELCDHEGRSLARIERLTCRSLRGRGKVDRFPGGDYTRIWHALTEPSPMAAACERLLIVADPDDELAEALEGSATWQSIPYDRCTWAEVARSQSLDEVARVIGVTAPDLGKERDVTGELTVKEILAAVHAMTAQDRTLPLRIVTRNAQPVIEGDVVVPGQSAVAGFLRVVRNELAMLDAASIDVEAASGAFVADTILAEALGEEKIDEIALRQGQRYAPAMVESGILQNPARVTMEPSADMAVRFDKHGSVYTASALPELTLPDDGYELRVERLGLQLNREEEPIGVIGEIVRTGADATRFAVGDRVSGMVPRTLASRLIVDETHCILEKVEDATLQSALLAPVRARAMTMALVSPLEPGDRALVVEGVLGDALASELHGMSITTTRVAADLSDWEGLHDDVKFDLIAGPLSDWSRRIGFFALAPGGRLVDLAQDPTPFALPPHCGRLVRIDNDLAVLREDMNYLDDLHAMFEGARPVIQDTQVFGCADLLADDAAAIVGQDWFELDVAKDNRPITVEIADAPHMDRSGTYLVTGGFSGLGRAVALWLADNGAGRIALAARRGIDTPGAFDLLDQLGERGALAEAYAADVSDADAVMELLRELHRPDAPLRGIYHAAGVIEDELVSDMTPTQVERVMGPKAGGAWALHVASSELDIELQQFVLFSRHGDARGR